MKKEGLIGFSVIILIIASLAIIEIVLATETGCVEQAWQCNGPGTETTYTACNVDICDACPYGTLAHQKECPDADYSKASQSNVSKAPKGGVIEFLRGLVQTAIGKPTQSNQNPTSIDRMNALNILLVVLGALISLLVFPLKLLKHISGKDKDDQKSPKDNPMQIKKSKSKSEEDSKQKKPHNIFLFIFAAIFIAIAILTYTGVIDFTDLGATMKNFSGDFTFYCFSIVLPIITAIIFFYISYRRMKKEEASKKS
jgi:hypothetical protein